MENSVTDSSIKKLKLLITIVDRRKGEFYLDVISQYDVNCQMLVGGLGTANSDMLELLGLEPHKRHRLCSAAEQCHWRESVPVPQQ